MIDLKHLFLSPRGRVGRQTFFLSIVLLVAANVVVSLIPFLGPLVALPILWPFTCLTAKRLHDAGRSAVPIFVVGALCLMISSAVALFGIMANDVAVSAAFFPVAGLMLLMSGIANLAALLIMVWAAIGRESLGANRYGPPEATPLTLGYLMNDRNV